MESIDFLKDKLYNLFERLSYLQIKYEYRSRLNTHIIHVLPTYCFEKDRQFAELQFELEDGFNDNFYEENILFITDNDLIKIENPILELGIACEEVIFDIVEPPIIIGYSFNKKEHYVVETGLNPYYEPPATEEKPPKSKWGKLKSTLIKKDLEKQHQGLFFD